MEKKRNLPPESSQLVEPPLKQHKSEAEQENLPGQEEKEDDQAFEQSPTSLFGQTNSPAFGSSMRKSPSTPAFGSSSTSFGGSSGFGQKPAVGGLRIIGPTLPTSVRKHLDALWKQFGLKAIQTAKQAAFSAASTPTFGARSLYPFGGPSSNPCSIISLPAIIEEDGGTSGQTAKLESTSAMPAYNDERYESCFAIAGADYCVIAADFTRGQTKILELSGKSVMAPCGFQADVKALQEALSAEKLRYECEHNKPMSCPEMNRLFCDIQKCHPKYVFIVLGGLDSEGKGCVFQHFGPGVATIASGAGHLRTRLIEPPIHKYKLPAKDVLARMSEAEAVDLAKNVFKSATNTGDKLDIVVLNANGLCRDYVDLRKDCP